MELVFENIGINIEKYWNEYWKILEVILENIGISTKSVHRLTPQCFLESMTVHHSSLCQMAVVSYRPFTLINTTRQPFEHANFED